MQWRLIESSEALRLLIAQNSGCETVIVDTEFMRRNTFYPEAALVQLCFVAGDAVSDMAWLIDPLKIDDPEPLAVLLANSDVLKVFHSASEDLEVFQRWLGVLPQPLFDTQRAAALLDRGFGLGYRALVQDVCAVDLPKGETRSDWLQRPLTESQCDYAGLDVTWLSLVWRELNEQCMRQGKLHWVLADGSDAISAVGADIYKLHARIKTAWKLNSRELGVLTAVCRWREKTARDRNKPRAWIVDDQACLKLAVEDPRTLNALKDNIGLPSSVVRRHGEQLLELLAVQREVSDLDLPAKLPPPLDAAQRDLVKKLKAKVREIAITLAVAPEVLVYSKDYELLLREAQGDVFELPVHWLGWREDAVLVALRQFLASASE
ncbi:MAG: ribonuclease D [Halioglobus sp.]|nr:ribonuclease D [Halioglobus sp.]